MLQRQEAVLAGSSKEVAALKAKIAALERQAHVLQLRSSGAVSEPSPYSGALLMELWPKEHH